MTRPDEHLWIERLGPLPGPPGGATVAIKDLIDVEGSVTTAGCRALAARGRPATVDATCVSRLRSSGARLAGKVNLHELAFGVTGVNPWYGTPANPADPGRIPGGSSSGSAVAVAIGEADISLGSDTGGSVRIPAACCGVVGLKTTHGRVPRKGVYPLAPSFDTVGPLAPTVAGVVAAMALLEPGFAPDGSETSVGRAVFEAGVEIDPVIDGAVDEALAAAELDCPAVEVPGWPEAWWDQQVLLSVEALASNDQLLAETAGVGIGEDTLARFERSRVAEPVVRACGERAARWVEMFVALVERAGVLALPTIATRPPELGESVTRFNLLTAPVNLAGLPAICVPVPVRSKKRPPTSIQLVAAHGREELLVSVAARIEEAAST